MIKNFDDFINESTDQELFNAISKIISRGKLSGEYGGILGDLEEELGDDFTRTECSVEISRFKKSKEFSKFIDKLIKELENQHIDDAKTLRSMIEGYICRDMQKSLSFHM